jgi:hypothetical protein
MLKLFLIKLIEMIICYHNINFVNDFNGFFFKLRIIMLSLQCYKVAYDDIFRKFFLNN